MNKTTSQLQIVTTRGVDALGNIINTRITPPMNINVFRCTIHTNAVAANPAGISNVPFLGISQAFSITAGETTLVFDRRNVGPMADELYIGSSASGINVYLYWEGELANFA
jgi:hypothetical protein